MMELDVATVLYQGAPSMNSVLEVILAVMLQFAQLAGIGAAIAAIVNVLKTFGVVGDQTAGRWFAALNLAGIALLVYLKLFRPDIAVEYIDAQAAALAQILLLLLGYVAQLGSGLVAHSIFADLRLPYIGKSFSRERARG
jgi:hypothetical protein